MASPPFPGRPLRGVGRMIASACFFLQLGGQNTLPVATIRRLPSHKYRRSGKAIWVHRRESSRQSNDIIAPPMCGDSKVAGAGHRAMDASSTPIAWTTGVVIFILDTGAVQ